VQVPTFPHMPTNRFGKTLALGVLAVAVFNTLAAVSMPVPDRRMTPAAMVLVAVTLLGHAAMYWWGDRVRARAGLGAYLAGQAALVFIVGLAGALFPVGLGLYVALTAEAVLVAGQRWGTVPITLGALALFSASAIAASDLYRGASAGLILAVTGVIAHAVAALVHRRSPPPTTAVAAAESSFNGKREPTDLTPRERDVLRALTRGARSSEIATELGISERTVKAHLASIYQKLGVESRAAAVAVAIQRGLT
jgi:DNA-binding CsgD family transcriptional regulator